MGITEAVWALGAIIAVAALARLANLRRSQLVDELRGYVKRQGAPGAAAGDAKEKTE